MLASQRRWLGGIGGFALCYAACAVTWARFDVFDDFWSWAPSSRLGALLGFGVATWAYPFVNWFVAWASDDGNSPVLRCFHGFLPVPMPTPTPLILSSPHGLCADMMYAIDFALDHCDSEGETFLRDWRGGAVADWPGFAEYVAKRRGL